MDNRERLDLALLEVIDVSLRLVEGRTGVLNLLEEILLKLIAFFFVLIDHDEAAQGATELGLTDHALAEGRLNLD